MMREADRKIDRKLFATRCSSISDRQNVKQLADNRYSRGMPVYRRRAADRDIIVVILFALSL